MFGMRTSARGPLLLSLLTFLQTGMTSTASAFNSPPAPLAEEESNEEVHVSLSEIAAQVAYWPALCAELEKAGSTTDASRCWWYAAEEITRRAIGNQTLADDVKALRTDWLWRGARLSLQSPEPGERAASLIEPPFAQSPSPDFAGVANLPPCASNLPSQEEECLATEAPEAIPIPLARPSKKKTVISGAVKKKRIRAAGAKPKAKTASVKRKARKKIQIVEPAAVRTEEIGASDRCRAAERHDHDFAGYEPQESEHRCDPSLVPVSRPRRPGYTMYCPPLADRVAPVMKPASSEARNSTQRATSAASPSLPTGICGRMFFSRTSLDTAITISVAM